MKEWFGRSGGLPEYRLMREDFAVWLWDLIEVSTRL